MGLVHSWELVTAVDGPGTRMTLFLSGCPLRCVYCHNPDTMDMKEGTLEDVEAIIKKIKRYRPVFNASGGGLTISGGEPLSRSRLRDGFWRQFTRRASTRRSTRLVSSAPGSPIMTSPTSISSSSM